MADLAALLDREASAEIDAILSEAKGRASEILSGAKSEAEGLLATRRRTLESQREAALVRARSAAQLEASALTLRAQHGVIQEVFAEVERKLDEMSARPDYADVLAALVREAVMASGAAPGDVRELVVNPADVAAAETAAQGLALAAKVDADPSVRAGVRLRVGNNVVIENTLYGRLEALREELAAEVAQVLLSKEA